MDELTIGEVARRAGVNTSTVRYYERIGLLPRTKRVNKHRRYDPAVLGSLALIDFAQKAGFSLAEIDLLLHGFSPETQPAERWQTLAQEKLPQLDAIIARAQEMKRMVEHTLSCECSTLDDCATVVGADESQGE
jgi:MerR family transcriptional regulator, redox-sensitive transcriptional activator SoxR